MLVIQPGREARDLLALVRTGRETPESVRKMIGGAPERRAVLLAFDVACMRLSRDRKRICKYLKPQNVSSQLRDRVALLMEVGWSKRKIRASLPVSIPLLDDIAREVHPGLYKRGGYGRRLSVQEQERLRAAIAAGTAPIKMRREFNVTHNTIQKYRRAMGLHEDSRTRKKLSPEQIAEATAMLKAGEKWIVVANTFGVTMVTLLQRVAYRKRTANNGKPH